MTVLRQLSMKVKAEGYPFVVTILFLATALSMLLAASISVPLSQTTRIFRLKADVDGVTRFVNFGIWGYCLDFVGRYALVMLSGCRHPPNLYYLSPGG